MSKQLATLVAATALVGAGLVALAGPAAAGVGPGDDRQLSVPTGWWTYTGLTATQVSNTLTQNGARLTDIKVNHSGATPTFSVTEVANSGAYGSGWYWYYDITPAQVVSLANSNTARPTVVQCYQLSGSTRCAAVMITNTGASAEPWAFYYGSASFIDSKVTSSNRMISFGRIQGTSLYTAVFDDNTGTNNTAWWYYRGVSVSQVSSALSTNHARLIDLDHNDDTGTFDVVMYANPSGTPWYWYVGASLGGLVSTASQNGQRLFDITPYSSGGSTVWAGLMVDNLDAASQAVYNVLAPAISSGTWGFELKPVGGAPAASLQTGTVFEPASALKVLYHYTSIVNEQAGNTTNSTVVTYHYNPSDPGNPGICPDNYATTATTNLANADTLMMQQSDNRMTRGILELYGKPAMLAEAAHLGLTSTAINHNIGCPTPTTHNQTTLSDLDRVYEAYATGTDITVTTWRNQFSSRMLNKANYPSYSSAICPVVQQEASKLGKSSTVATNFCNKITWIAKGGSYQYGASLPYTVSLANGSLTGLPYKVNKVITPKTFFYGDYVDNAQITSSSQATAIGNARNQAYLLALTPYIDAALTTW